MTSEKSASNWNEIEQSQKGLFYSKQLLGSDLLQSLLAFVKASETHEPANRIFEELLSRVYQATTQWTEIYQFDTLELQLKGEQFFINENRIRPKPNNIKKLKRLAKILRERGITGLTVPRSPDRDQLRRQHQLNHQAIQELDDDQRRTLQQLQRQVARHRHRTGEGWPNKQEQERQGKHF